MILKYDVLKLFCMTAGLLFRRFTSYILSNIKKVDPIKNIFAGLLWGISGFYIGQVCGIQLINSKAGFIKQRIFYESQINFKREKNKMFIEYPFMNREPYLLGDDEHRLRKYNKLKRIL